STTKHQFHRTRYLRPDQRLGFLHVSILDVFQDPSFSQEVFHIMHICKAFHHPCVIVHVYLNCWDLRMVASNICILK
ncbi:unnamed protein product, partial [Heterotrigona itama]